MNSIRKVTIIAGFIAAAISIASGQSIAQEVIPSGEGVADRPRPDYDARGLSLGGFQFYPSANLGGAVDSNIFAAETNSVDDIYGIVEASGVVRSSWSRHVLTFDASTTHASYDENPSEDRHDWGAGGQFQVDLGRGSFLRIDGHRDDLSEPRASVDGPQSAIRPTQYKRSTVGALLTLDFNRLSLEGEVDHIQFDYEDTSTADGAGIEQDFRDRDEASVRSAAKYEISPATEFVIRGGYFDRDYNLEASDTAFRPNFDADRDSTGFETEAGLAFEVTRLIYGEVRGGYASQNYDSTALPDIEGATFGVDLLWNPSGLTSFRLSGDRRIEDSTSVGVGGRFTSEASISVEHELLRHFVLSANARWAEFDFQGGPNRNDDLMAIGISARWFLSRRVHIESSYEFSDRDSNLPTFDYERSVAQIVAKLQL